MSDVEVLGGIYSYWRFDRLFSTEYGPIYCLPFDRSGARRPGVPALAGSYVGPRQVGKSVFTFNFQSAGLPSTHRLRRGYDVNFRDNGNEL